MNEKTGITGHISWKLIDASGNIKQQGESENIVTTQGDHYYVDQLSDAGGSVAQLMVLGTGAGTPAKADTWVSGYFEGNGAIAGTAGSVTISTHASSASVLQYVGTFSAGYATQNGITRVGLTNMTPAADGNGTPDDSASFFIAHGTIDPTVNKGASDTLVVSWYHTVLGA